MADPLNESKLVQVAVKVAMQMVMVVGSPIVMSSHGNVALLAVLHHGSVAVMTAATTSIGMVARQHLRGRLEAAIIMVATIKAKVVVMALLLAAGACSLATAR